ncbi:uncharacterized protein [Rutidosis leptorrhynchoides]|uniref:uncharacterized protein n=1 Tax=Rutidosis leptorrhynchoides TaxID=125765 RepID=UPI003A994002
MAEDGKLKIEWFDGKDFAFWKLQKEDYLYQKKLHQPLLETEPEDHFTYNHDEFDTTHMFSFEITGSRPSTSSSPLRPFSPLLLIETLSRKSFSYGKLPLEPIKLTVLKLDGSSFDISVVKNPTLAQLKQAVEDAFSHLPKHGIGKVSWSHVWAQFCLCFDGQKLLHDQDTVILHGIKDGDQLQFVRHTSISYNLVKERSEKHDYDHEESQVSSGKQEVQKHVQKEVDNQSGNVQENRKQLNNEENEEDSCDEIAVNITCQCSWAHLLRRLFSYRRRKHSNTSYEELASLNSS